jgi:hypothetical protein
LEVYPDGSFELWRSVSVASQPATPVGRFQGQVPEGLFNALVRQASAAASAGDLTVVPPPDASLDHIQLAGAQARMGRHSQPEGPWGALVETLRQAIGSLTDQPVAALALHVSPLGNAAHLRHLGSENLRVDLRGLRVRAVLWNQRKKEGDWRWTGEGLEHPVEFEASPGWYVDLPFGHGFTITSGLVVAAYVTAALYDGNQLIQVSLESRSPG